MTTDKHAGRDLDLSERWNVPDLQREIDRLNAQLAADRERWLAAIAERDRTIAALRATLDQSSECIETLSDELKRLKPVRPMRTIEELNLARKVVQEAFVKIDGAKGIQPLQLDAQAILLQGMSVALCWVAGIGGRTLQRLIDGEPMAGQKVPGPPSPPRGPHPTEFA